MSRTVPTNSYFLLVLLPSTVFSFPFLHGRTAFLFVSALFPFRLCVSLYTFCVVSFFCFVFFLVSLLRSNVLCAPPSAFLVLDSVLLRSPLRPFSSFLFFFSRSLKSVVFQLLVAEMSIACLFEDRFEVRSVDNSKFERVSRLKGKSSGFDADIQLDVNSDIFPIREKQRLYIGLTNQLQQTTRKDDAAAWSSALPFLEEYDYVMYGKIFRLEESSSERRTLYASFGGLLMALTADKHVVGDLELDMRVYILIRRSDDVNPVMA